MKQIVSVATFLAQMTRMRVKMRDFKRGKSVRKGLKKKGKEREKEGEITKSSEKTTTITTVRWLGIK